MQHCLDCHGGKATKGDLDLSDRKPLVKSGVLEGGSKESRLAALIRHEEEPHMPQKAPKLPDATIAEIAPLDRPGRPVRPAARRSRLRAQSRRPVDRRADQRLLVVPAAGAVVSPPTVRDAGVGPHARSTGSSSPRSSSAG